MMLRCEKCGYESTDLEEVSYYSINGDNYSDEYDIERHAQDPDALAYCLCIECAEKFDFSIGK